MRQEGYGAGYQYDHDSARGILRPGLFPRRHGAAALLCPRGRGFEEELKERLEQWQKLRARRR